MTTTKSKRRQLTNTYFNSQMTKRAQTIQKTKGKPLPNNTFQQLPIEILLLILRHICWPDRGPTLYSFSLLNKHFHTLVNPLIWENPTLPSTAIVQRLLIALDHVPPQPPSSSTSPGKHIQKLYLHGNFLTNTHLVRLLPHIPSLQHFTIPSRTNITDLGIQRLPRHCPNLTFLELHHNEMLSRSSIIALSRHCPHLTVIHLRHCHLEQHPDLFTPLTTCPSLKRLTIQNCTLDELSAAQTLVQLHHLTYIRLWGFQPTTMKSLLLAASTPTTTTNNNNNNTTMTSYPWPDLKECFFLDCQEIDNTIWLPFLKTHPLLEDIGMQDCNVTDSCMQPMATLLPHLIGILLIGETPISPQGIRQLIRHSSTLKRVQCNNCSHIRLTDFDELADLPRPICFLDFIVDMDANAIGKIRNAF